MMRWKCDTYMGERSACEVLVGVTEGKNHLQDLGIDRKILKWIFKKWDEESWAGLI
jgi:hypothetical protein